MPLLKDYEVGMFSSSLERETRRAKEGWTCDYRSIICPTVNSSWQQCDPETTVIWVWSKVITEKKGRKCSN